jgi:hypothetical protein
MLPPKLPTPDDPVVEPPVDGGSARLTQLLAEKGQGLVTLPDGRVVKRDDALTELMWDAALGLVVVGQDEHGPVHAKPDTRMALAIFERREGKTPNAIPDDANAVTAADKVEEVAVNRINAQADAVVPVSEQAENLDLPGDEDQGAEAD